MNQSPNFEQELFQKLFSAAPDPILIVDSGGKIVLSNPEAQRKFGYSADELNHQPLEILLPDRFKGAHKGYRQNFFEKPTVRPMGSGLDLYAKQKNGEEFPVEISLSPLQSQDGPLVISILRDITERKNAEKNLKLKAKELEQSNFELGRSNHELEQFAYIASHDLQEPLRSIAGACQFLQKRYHEKLDADAQEFIGFAVDGAKRMQELINDLLTYSRVTTKSKTPEMISLKKILDQVLAGLRFSIDESHAQITSDELPVVNVDRSQFLQLLQNLIANGLKFRGKSTPMIHIGVKDESDKWHFEVKDNGIGIDPKYFNRLFVIFKRLHTREEYPGTGIGLATCKKIVERHGGNIWVESQVGQGTTFHFTLPK